EELRSAGSAGRLPVAFRRFVSAARGAFGRVARGAFGRVARRTFGRVARRTFGRVARRTFGRVARRTFGRLTRRFRLSGGLARTRGYRACGPVRLAFAVLPARRGGQRHPLTRALPLAAALRFDARTRRGRPSRCRR